MPLSQKQLEYLALAWECFESQPKIDYDKLAQLTKLSNGHCAREMFRCAKKKLTTEYAGALGDATGNTPRTTKTTTPRGKPSTPATITNNRKKQNAGGSDETPTKGKRGRPATNGAANAASPGQVKKESFDTGNLNARSDENHVDSVSNDRITSETGINNPKRRHQENTSDNENAEDDEDLHTEGPEKKKTKKSKTTAIIEPQIKPEPMATENNHRGRRPSTPLFKHSSATSSSMSTRMGMGLGMGMGMSMFGENDEGDHHSASSNNNIGDEIEDDDMFGTFTTFQ